MKLIAVIFHPSPQAVQSNNDCHAQRRSVGKNSVNKQKKGIQHPNSSTAAFVQMIPGDPFMFQSLTVYNLPHV